MSDDLGPPDNEEQELDAFLDRVGQDIDPVKYFINALKECGCEVDEREDGGFDIKNACPNLATHTSNGFCEILCTKCFIALDIHPIDIPTVAEVEGEVEEDDIDAFLRVVGTQANTGDYPRAEKRTGSGITRFETDDTDDSPDYPVEGVDWSE